jgi:hypothetical protein
MISVPALAQQPAEQSQKMQDEADKGVKTRNSGDSGYVADQEKPGASSHAPGQPDTKRNQTTTGEGTGTRESDIGGGVTAGQQEKKPASEPAGKSR